MADLSTDSIERVTVARRQAESELKRNLSGVRGSDDIEAYLPAFTSFACALCDAEAVVLLGACEDSCFQKAIENEVGPRIVEGKLPDRSLSRTRASRTDEVKRLSIEHEMETDLLWEIGPDGTRRPARAKMQGLFAQHGDWEDFAPAGVRFQLRFPSNGAIVRDALPRTLHRRAFYWDGQFAVRACRKVLMDSEQGVGSIVGNLPKQARPVTGSTNKGRKRGGEDGSQRKKCNSQDQRTAVRLILNVSWKSPMQILGRISVSVGAAGERRRQGDGG